MPARATAHSTSTTREVYEPSKGDVAGIRKKRDPKGGGYREKAYMQGLSGRRKLYIQKGSKLALFLEEVGLLRGDRGQG